MDPTSSQATSKQRNQKNHSCSPCVSWWMTILDTILLGHSYTTTSFSPPQLAVQELACSYTTILTYCLCNVTILNSYYNIERHAGWCDCYLKAWRQVTLRSFNMTLQRGRSGISVHIDKEQCECSNSILRYCKQMILYIILYIVKKVHNITTIIRVNYNEKNQ